MVRDKIETRASERLKSVGEGLPRNTKGPPTRQPLAFGVLDYRPSSIDVIGFKNRDFSGKKERRPLDATLDGAPQFGVSRTTRHDTTRGDGFQLRQTRGSQRAMIVRSRLKRPLLNPIVKLQSVAMQLHVSALKTCSDGYHKAADTLGRTACRWQFASGGTISRVDPTPALARMLLCDGLTTGQRRGFYITTNQAPVWAGPF